MRRRKRIDCLGREEQERLRAAFRALMARPDGSGSYRDWASIHAHCCPHLSELFLPWHRAYIFAIESALQAAAGDESVSLPYWDWTTTREIPPLLEQEPLACERYPSHDPDRLPRPEAIEHLLDQPSFLSFGGAGCSPPSSGGCLENLHGIVHTWVGPQMAEPPSAAFDPIFWFHHAYVDRVWTLWQSRHDGAPECLTAPLQGIPGEFTVRDVLDAGALGYRYEAGCSSVLATTVWDRSTGRVRIAVRVPPLARELRVTAHDLQLVGSGPAPIEIDVRVDGQAQGRGVISLFALGHQHHGGAMSRCVPLDGTGHVGCVPLHGGDATAWRNLVVEVALRWREEDGPGGAVRVGSMGFEGC